MRYFFLLAILITYIMVFFRPVAAVSCVKKITEVPEKPIALTANWLFKKSDNPAWKQKRFRENGWKQVKLPDSARDKTAKIYGFHWYRCHFQLGKKVIDSDKFLAFRLGYIRDVDWVYLNGQLIGNTGKQEKPDGFKDRIYSLPKYLLTAGENVIAVRIYSATPAYGVGITPEIGEEEVLQKRMVQFNLSNTIFGFVFILMGLFFIIASVVKSTNKSNLYFSLFSILLGIYVLLRSSYRYQIVPDDPVFAARLDLLSLIPLPALFLNFIAFYVGYARNRLFWLYEILIVTLWGFSAVLDISKNWDMIVRVNAVLLIVPILFGCYIIIKNFKNNKRKIKYIAIGISFLIPCVVVDALSATRILNLPGTMHYGFMFFLINISLQLSDEMVQNYHSYLRLEKDLIQMERLKTNFLYNISAEFKYCTEKVIKLIKQERAKKKEQVEPESIQQLQTYTDMTGALIYDALLLSQLEDKSYQPKNENFSVNDVIKETIHLVESRISQKKQNIKININTGDLHILQSKELVFNILYHLVENAYQYSPPDSQIQIATETNGNFFTIRVSDSGSGLSESEREKVMRKFVRGERTEQEEDNFGAGIGLNIVEAATKILDGKIHIESNGGKGCAFTVSIPFKS